MAPNRVFFSEGIGPLLLDAADSSLPHPSAPEVVVGRDMEPDGQILYEEGGEVRRMDQLQATMAAP